MDYQEKENQLVIIRFLIENAGFITSYKNDAGYDFKTKLTPELLLKVIAKKKGIDDFDLFGAEISTATDKETLEKVIKLLN